jgi:23S rRNA (cytosine1962-C5)-methyltransferase
MVDRAAGGVEAGTVVRVIDRDGRFVGQAFWNPKSEIALRLLTRSEEPAVDEAWFADAAKRAVALRREALGLERVTDAYRVIHAEGDRLPGLIVDLYGDVLSCQISSLGIYRNFQVIRDALTAELKTEVVHVTADPKLAKREGFPIPRGAGRDARTKIREHGLTFDVDCAAGHKTGFFLDQRESRLRIRQLAKDKRVLDLFSYTGGFALNAARGRASQVIAVDLDEMAVAAGRKNAQANNLDERITFVHKDAFDVLRNTQDGAYDLMIVDPAKQAQERGDVRRAIDYYTDLNRLVFEKAPQDGLVMTCSCTGLVDEQGFLQALSRAAQRAGRHVSFLEVSGAPADHPVAADTPEGRYLNVVLCRVS